MCVCRLCLSVAIGLRLVFVHLVCFKVYVCYSLRVFYRGGSQNGNGAPRRGEKRGGGRALGGG